MEDSVGKKNFSQKKNPGKELGAENIMKREERAR